MLVGQFFLYRELLQLRFFWMMPCSFFFFIGRWKKCFMPPAKSLKRWSIVTWTYNTVCFWKRIWTLYIVSKHGSYGIMEKTTFDGWIRKFSSTVCRSLQAAFRTAVISSSMVSTLAKLTRKRRTRIPELCRAVPRQLFPSCRKIQKRVETKSFKNISYPLLDSCNSSAAAAPARAERAELTK